MPQDPHHDNKIWKSWHGGCPYYPRLSSAGSCITRPHYATGDNESSNENSEETETHHPLAELLQFQQFQNQLACLDSAIHPPTPMADLTQLTDKLQHLTMILQPHPTTHPIEEPMHKLSRLTDTLCTTQREANLTMTMLQESPTFDGQDSWKLKDFFMDIETTNEILTESHTCLAKAKSCGLTWTLIHEALQAGKCWDELKGILSLKLCNVNIHTYTSCFMYIQQKDNKTLAAYVNDS